MQACEGMGQSFRPQQEQVQGPEWEAAPLLGAGASGVGEVSRGQLARRLGGGRGIRVHPKSNADRKGRKE